ncbi:MAG: hypothetical protein OXN89_10285 [Bryobacterales bacterium]|nr:hypothetical protein [Bryobacterales bacterium]
MWVRLQRHLHMPQRSEIRVDFTRRRITLSAASLSSLWDRFLHLLGQLHIQHAPGICTAMQHG